MLCSFLRSARLVAVAILTLWPIGASVAEARERHYSSDDIIVDLPPLRPMRPAPWAKSGAPQSLAAPKAAEEPAALSASAPAAPKIAAEPAPVAAPAPKPVQAGVTQAAPAPAQIAAPAAPVAVQPKVEAPAPVVVAPQAAPAQWPADAPARVASPQAEPQPKIAAPPPVAAKVDAPAPVLKTQAPAPAVAEAPEAEGPVVDAAPGVSAPTFADGAALPGAEPKPQPLDAPAPVLSEPKDVIASGVQGPAEVRLGERATLSLPAGRAFLAPEKARLLLERIGGAWDASTQGVVVATDADAGWIAYVDLLDDGHIKADDAKSLDPALLLANYKAGVARDNEARVKERRPALEAEGWVQEPRFDEAAHRLSFCVGAQEQGGAPRAQIVNCASYALGRQGAFKVILSVAGEEEGKKHLADAEKLAEAIAFDNGKGFGDFDAAADKSAPYGLAELVAGNYAPRKAAPAQTTPRAKQEALTDAVLSLIMDNIEIVGALVLGLLFLLHKFSRKSDGATAPTTRGDKSARTADAASAPGWTRFVTAARNKLPAGAKRAAAATEDAAAEASPGVAEAALRGEKSAVAGGFGARIAAARAALASRFARKPKEAPVAVEDAGPLVAAEESGRSPLGKMAAIMRRKAPEAASAQVNLSRLSRGRPAARAAADDADQDEFEAIQPSAQDDAAAPAEPDEFGLVEPGDEIAASAAITAGAALREARG